MRAGPTERHPVSRSSTADSTRRRTREPRRRLNLMYRFLRDPRLFALGHRVEWIDPPLETEALEFLQQGLREEVGRLGLTPGRQPVR
jgi:hypothetical protein